MSIPFERPERDASLCAALATTVALSFLLVANSFAAQEHLTFAAALDAAVQRAPMVAARRAAAEGATALKISASQLPDPRLTLGAENLPVTGPDRFSLTDEPMTMGKIGWMQEMPNRGKRKARAEAAQALADREQAVLAAELQMTRQQTALAWVERYFVEKRLTLFSELERENQVLQKTVNARIAAGRVLPADALMTQQEALQLADRRDELDRQRAQAQAALRRWVGEAADAPLSGEPAIPLIDPAHLRANLSRHVELAEFAPMARMAQAEAQELQAGKKGDWSWEVSYSKRSSEFGDMVSVQVGLELPLFAGRRRDPQIFAKHKEVARIEAEREEMLRRHAQEIEAQLAEQQEFTRKLTRLRDSALPLMEQRVRLTTASYQAGRSDLGAVLAARRDRTELRLRTIEIEAQFTALRARLAYLYTEHR